MRYLQTILATLFSCAVLTCAGKADRESDALQVASKNAPAIMSFIRKCDSVEMFFVPFPRPNRNDAPGCVLTNHQNVTSFVEDIKLQPKRMCHCSHDKMLRFRQGKSVLVASICDHCLDMIDAERKLIPDRVVRYKMPKVVWAEFRRYYRLYRKPTVRLGGISKNKDGQIEVIFRKGQHETIYKRMGESVEGFTVTRYDEKQQRILLTCPHTEREIWLK